MKTETLCIFVLLFWSQVLAHSYLTVPISRGNQRQTTSGCRPPACPGPCERPAAQASTSPTVVTRGSVVSIKWPRNNHPGGFVRLAWSLTASSDNRASFDSGADLYTCFETGSPTCKPDNINDPNGGDSGGQENCGVSYTIPTWLSDGRWTLQWAWFGGGNFLADYFGCIDYQVTGGAAITAQGQPVFRGGDFANPNSVDVCKYFNNVELYKCNAEPCNTGTNLGFGQTGAPTNIAIAPPETGIADGGDDGDAPVACASNDQCASGVCEVSGFCFKSKGSLDAGGIAALVFAFLFLILVVVGILFLFVNKTEWRNWRPFRR